MKGFREYQFLAGENKAHKEKIQADRDRYLAEFAADYPVIFNLPKGKKYKSNVLEYKKDYTGLHPTQKPIALMEDLIRTYTNEGQLVLDFTMGSGTTGVACKNLNRRFIGIELDKDYFEIAQKRIKDA
jgi:site-specific DNA-methyltransferase (adenine-specific)